MQVFIYETSFGSLKIRNLKNFELNIALVVLVSEKKKLQKRILRDQRHLCCCISFLYRDLFAR